MPENAIQVAHGLIQAIRPSLLGLTLPQVVDENDRMIFIMDSSEVASRFTIGCFITTIRAGSRWYHGHFCPWNQARIRQGENLSYKRVGDKAQDLKSLAEYLTVADQCLGVLLSISTPKRSQPVHSSPRRHEVAPDLEEFRSWSNKDFERLLRTGVAVSVAASISGCDPDDMAVVHDTDQLFDQTRFDASQRPHFALG